MDNYEIIYIDPCILGQGPPKLEKTNIVKCTSIEEAIRKFRKECPPDAMILQVTMIPKIGAI